MLAPIPVPPPVMTILFSLAEFSERVGEIVGYGAERHVLVSDGIGVGIVEGRKDCIRFGYGEQ
jgi:hypothetical protein